MSLTRKGRDRLNDEEVHRRKELQELFWRATCCIESFAKQKARSKWLLEGDHNSKFFHSIVNWKGRKNLIRGLFLEEEWVEDPLKVKNEASRFFHNRFSEECWDRPLLDGVHFNQITQIDNVGLVDRFEEEEVKEIIWKCKSAKSSGPGGFNFKFIKTFWHVLKDDIIRFMEEFHRLGIFQEALIHRS